MIHVSGSSSKSFLSLLLGLTWLVQQVASQTVGQVTGFTLINASTNQVIRPLTLGSHDTIDLEQDGTSLSMRADSSGNIGSVRLELDGSVTKTENVAPYALGGDRSGNYYVVTGLTSLGLHTVSATPFSGSNGSGQQGTKITITVDVVNSGAGPAPTPTAAPTSTVSVHPDIVQVINVVGANPKPSWSDSYSVGNNCYCDTTFDVSACLPDRFYFVCVCVCVEPRFHFVVLQTNNLGDAQYRGFHIP